MKLQKWFSMCNCNVPYCSKDVLRVCRPKRWSLVFQLCHWSTAVLDLSLQMLPLCSAGLHQREGKIVPKTCYMHWIFNLKKKWLVLWAAEFKMPGLHSLFYLWSVAVGTWLLYFNMLIWISVKLIASPMQYYGEVISGETFDPVDSLRQIVKHTQNLLGKGRKRRVTDRHLHWMGLSSMGISQND